VTSASFPEPATIGLFCLKSVAFTEFFGVDDRRLDRFEVRLYRQKSF
jgi:hypothetical protein